MPWQTLWKKLTKNNRQLTPNETLDFIYLRGYQDFEFFVRSFFPHYCQKPFSRMHQDFFEDEVKPMLRARRDVIAAPRGHAKTTFKALFKVIHAIVYDYEPFILIVAHSTPEAEEKVETVLQELCHNKLLQEVYGPLAPVRGQTHTKARWGKKRFVTQNGVRVMGKSRGEQLRGIRYGANRPSLMICDDIESLEGVMTYEQRHKTYDWFMKDLMKAGQTDGSTNITVIGTCLHPESLLMNLLETPGWNGRKYQAVTRFSDAKEHWKEYTVIYTNLSNPTRVKDAQAYFRVNQSAMLADTEVLWPEGDPYEQLMRMRIDEGEASFRSEKQNEPYDPDRQIFKMTEAKQFEFIIENNRLLGLRWLGGSEKVVMLDQFEKVVAFHDPAMAEKKESDYAAIVVCAKDYEGHIYVLDTWVERATPDGQIRKAFKLFDRWGFGTLYLESNNFQKLLNNVYREYQEQRPGKNMSVSCVTSHENKYKRISMMEPDIVRGHLLFSSTLPKRFMDQMTMFPTSYDDGPDALHGAWYQLRRRGGRVICHPGQSIPM